MFLKGTLPDRRRGRLQELMAESGRQLRLLEAHNGASAKIVSETAVVQPDGSVKGFDGIWVSSLTESASRGLPDIELQGMTSRLDLVREMLTVTDKPIVVDGDTGGTIDQLSYTIRSAETLGVSALIIEDKVFPKANSLDVTRAQILEDPEVFARKIAAGKEAQLSDSFLLIARIESFIAGQGLADALMRSERYLQAGADGIVIHSRSKTPDEVRSFALAMRDLGQGRWADRPLGAIPTTYNSITESALYHSGFRFVIHANYLLRSALVAMRGTAETILRYDRSAEAEARCSSLTSFFT